MKVRIEKKFTDKNTGEKYNVGDVKDFETARAEELLADKRELVSAIEEANLIEVESTPEEFEKEIESGELTEGIPVEHEIKHTKKRSKK